MSSAGISFETTITPVEYAWFATQVDRDFDTHHYGDGTRLYKPNGTYILIQGVSYDPETNTLIGRSSGHTFSINTEPNSDLFKSTVYKRWKHWDNIYGEHQGEDRCDYEPWMLDSIKALAIELEVYTPKEDEIVTMYHGKRFTSSLSIKDSIKEALSSKFSSSAENTEGIITKEVTGIPDQSKNQLDK